MSRLLSVLFVLILLAALVQTARHHATLPEQVATHFDIRGEPDAWMSRNAHAAFQAGLALFIAAVFAGLARFIDRLPARFINVPHREYWFAPERRAASLQAIASLLQLIGCATLGFFMFIFHHVHRANLSGGRLELELMPLIIGQFLLVIGLVVIGLFRFRRPPVTRR
jgi:uncharacterized membrane protein